MAALFGMAGAAAVHAEEAAGEPKPYRPVEWTRGIFFHTEDDAVQVRAGGYLQYDGRFYLDDGQNLGTDTFLMRRVRLIFDASFYQRFDVRIAPDFGQGKTVLFDSYVDVKFDPVLKLRVGKFKPPVGLERLQSATNLVFVERGLPTNLVPNRDVGAQFYGDVGEGVLSYALGLFNGVPDGGNGDVDTNDGKDSVARLFFRPFKRTSMAGLRGLGVGVAGSRGSQAGALPSYVTAGQLTFFKYAAAAVAAGKHTRIAPQLYYYAGPFGLLGEYVVVKQEVADGAARGLLSQEAWQAAASFVVTGEKASYDGVTPKRPLGPKGGGIGAIEIAVRANQFRVDDRAFPAFADLAASARRARAWGGGVNWYLNPYVKFMLDYEQTRFDRGAAAPQDREEEKVILFRLQISS